MNDVAVTREHDVPGGAGWSLALPRGCALRLTALGDGANASMLIYALADPLERLNIPDTLKAQMSGCVRPPMVLMSDLGRALCSVTASTVDWHDAVTGYGADAGQLLLDELATLGLGRRDLHAPVNWFSKVTPVDDERGSLRYVPGHARAGDHVALRAEQDLRLVLATAPHPMDPALDASGIPVAGVRATVERAAPVSATDPSWTFRPESARALAAVS
jgi:uncharacterized protein YcgI (DUF1989 family)